MDKKGFSITIGLLKPLVNQRRSFSEALKLAKKKGVARILGYVYLGQ